MDKWDRKTNFNCESCMFYVPKRDAAIGGVVFDTPEGCCRHNAPTMKGYPVVWNFDWCGEHKIGSNPVRDGKSTEYTDDPNELLESYNVPQIVKTDALVAAEKKLAEGKAEIKSEIIEITREIRMAIQNTTNLLKTQSYLKPKFTDLSNLLEKL